MIAIPAIDIREGACVQLVGGSYDAEQVRFDDPPGIAHRWEYAGFRRVHIVDLDAATDRGSNAEIIREVLRATSMEAQVGGGVRDEEKIEALLRDGATLVNTARGDVVDEAALVRELVSGRIEAGLDVFAHEPAVPAELLDLPNVVLTPHVGSATTATRAAMTRVVVENVLALQRGEPLVTPVP